MLTDPCTEFKKAVYFCALCQNSDGGDHECLWNGENVILSNEEEKVYAKYGVSIATDAPRKGRTKTILSHLRKGFDMTASTKGNVDAELLHAGDWAENTGSEILTITGNEAKEFVAAIKQSREIAMVPNGSFTLQRAGYYVAYSDGEAVVAPIKAEWVKGLPDILLPRKLVEVVATTLESIETVQFFQNGVKFNYFSWASVYGTPGNFASNWWGEINRVVSVVRDADAERASFPSSLFADLKRVMELEGDEMQAASFRRHGSKLRMIYKNSYADMAECPPLEGKAISGKALRNVKRISPRTVAEVGQEMVFFGDHAASVIRIEGGKAR